MSLYTPVFPSLHEVNSSREGLPENSLATTSGKQRNSVELLRDIHLFLSTQSDMLSPPSRPNSPMFDHRTQKVRNTVQDILDASRDEPAIAKWTRVSQTLKLGCVRRRHWLVSRPEMRAPEQGTNWILPEEESEWIEREKKQEENRRLKTKTNASQLIGNSASTPPDLHKPGDANLAKLSQSNNVAQERRPAGVSPSVLRAAKEKVRKWQASVACEVRYDAATRSSPASSSGIVGAAVAASKAQGPRRSRTLDFAVVKPATKQVIGKKGRGSLSQPVESGSTPKTYHRSDLPKPPTPSNIPEIATPVNAEKAGYKGSPKSSLVEHNTAKIADVSETPYLPPSFPAHLETSTPLPNSMAVVRAKPPPILPIPVSSSTPPPSISVNPPDDRPLGLAEPHAANVSSSQPPQIKQPGKRSRAPPTSLEGIADGPLVTPPAKRLRTLSENRATPVSEHAIPVSPNGVYLDFGTAPSHLKDMGAMEMASSVPLTAGKSDGRDVGVAENIPSPTKSVRSYFSAPDSDPADSPVKGNLLLESPVSPMLSYAQNPSLFFPQITSTQIGKGSPTPMAGRTNSGVFGMGYSSQFDIERHVDRVSELLEKDVDFDGWLRDVRTVEESAGQPE